jgi:hypothetical protein
MPVLVQFDFPFNGPFGAELATMARELALSINQEPGFVWKIWLENPATKESGGTYLFRDHASATAYIAKHSPRLAQFGVTGPNVKIFDVNSELTLLNHGPIS